MKRLFATLVLLAPVAALAQAAATKPAEGPKRFSFALEAKKVHEECQRIEAGEKRRWSWKADGAVDFNIHFHRGNDVSYPVKRDGMRGDGGTFTAKDGEDYCWMWTARDKAVKVEGLIEAK